MPPTAPVNWFQELAPLLDSVQPSRVRSTAHPQMGTSVAGCNAAFPSIEALVERERDLQMLGAPEPAEVVRMREEAQETARQLVVDAYVQAQTIEDESRERGYREGYEKGYVFGETDGRNSAMVQSEAERKVLHEDIAGFVANVEAQRRQIWEGIEPQVMQLVFDLARHVIKQEVDTTRSVALAVVRNALRRAADSGSLRIRVNTADLEEVRGNREELIGLLENIRHVEIVEDRRVGPGGCIVETDRGNIDARIETQIGEMGATLQRLSQPQEPEQKAA